jgi:pyroglutamyl-peptidase
MRLLLTGFGPFPGVTRNPTQALVEGLNGRVCGGVTLSSVVLPVTYGGAIEETLAHVATLQPFAVLGTGVAVRRAKARVESTGRRRLGGRPDAAGQPPDLVDGPDRVTSLWDVDRFTALLGAVRSDEAGDYVCNAWLYGVQRALSLPVGFLHIPEEGFEPDTLVHALAALFPTVPRQVGS